MTTLTRRLASVAAFAFLIAGCGGAAATQAPTSPSAAVPSAAASTAPSVTASSAPSEPVASVEPSVAIPSFVLPSEAKDLEALLPSKMCGATALKASQSGQSMGNDEDFAKVLAALGKSPSDVSYAIAIGGDSGCAAGIFRIKGVDTGAMQAAFAAQAQKSGDTYTDRTVGGKAVKVQAGTSGDSTSYFYFSGDAVLFVSAKDDAQAGPILQQMP